MIIPLSQLPVEDQVLLADPDFQFPVWGTITSESIGRLIDGFQKNFEKIKKEGKIFLNINSCGSYEDGALATLYTLLRLNNIEVATVVSGDAFSAGFFAFMLGEKTRYVYSTASLLIHEAQFNFDHSSDSATDLAEKARVSAVATDAWFKFIADRINWPEGRFEGFRQQFSHDRRLTPQQALDYGFATAIIDPFN